MNPSTFAELAALMSSDHPYFIYPWIRHPYYMLYHMKSQFLYKRKPIEIAVSIQTL